MADASKPVALADSIAAMPTRGGASLRGVLLKELLVVSRRGRSYVLRAAYLVALGVYVVGVYLSLVSGDGVSSYDSYQMAQLGKTVTAYIVFFQLAGATLVAVALASTALHEEIRRRTLTALLVTPLSDWQIVVGKLLGRLMPLLTLVLLILPLLGVVRVFGGVEFTYLLAATGLTLCWAALAGAFTMYVSLRCRGPFVTAATSVGLIAVHCLMTGLMPVCCIMTILPGLMANPFLAMTALTIDLLHPGSGILSAYVHTLWPIQCVIMLGLAWLFTYLTGQRLRVVAAERLFGGEVREAPLFDATSQQRVLHALGSTPAVLMPPLPATASPPPASIATAAPPPWPLASPPLPYSAEIPRPVPAPPGPTRQPDRRETIRSVRGSPVLWKELRQQLHHRLPKWLFLAIMFVITVTYTVLITTGAITSRITQAYMMNIWLGVLLVPLLLALSNALAGERESRSLTALLTTPLSDWRILRDKAVGAFLTAWPGWMIFAIHLIIFGLLGVLHPLGLALAGLAILSVVGLHLGAGLWLGSKLKRPAAVLMGNALLAGTLWAGLPAVAKLLRRVLPWDGWDTVLRSNPFMQIYVAIKGVHWDPTTAFKTIIHFQWPGYDWPDQDFTFTALTIVGWSALYLAAAAVMVVLAKRNLRNDML
ncbi:MAG: ABC transporter permease [Phycisphaerae bacterium]|nr:ABC transporter permease [Phycisphaerae bacterium]